MKKKQLFRKFAVIMLVFTLLVGVMPTAAYASTANETINGKEYTLNFDKSYKAKEKIKFRFCNIKIKTKVNFGTIRVKGYVTANNPEKIAYVKVFNGGTLIAEGEVGNNSASVGRGFNVKVKGAKFRVTPCVYYSGYYKCCYLTVNVKGNGLDFDPIRTPLN